MRRLWVSTECFFLGERVRSAPSRSPIVGTYEAVLSVSFDDRTGSLFILVGNTCARYVFGYKPDLKLVHTKHIANQQVVGSIAALVPSGWSRLVGRLDDEFVSLKQAEYLNGNVFPASGRAGDAGCLGNVGSHGDRNSAEGLNAFSQRVD